MGNIPNQENLDKALSEVCSKHFTHTQGLKITGRRPNPNSSSWPSEIIEAKTPEGETTFIFVKYGIGPGHSSYGHRGDLVYEAQVYRKILDPLQAPVPSFYGFFTDPTGNSGWLMLENIYPNRHPKTKVELAAAARWIGLFHASLERVRFNLNTGFLNTYDCSYYRGWIERTRLHVDTTRQDFPWLEKLCDHCINDLTIFLTDNPVVIHGEYYTKNILCCNSRVLPVDWESAAMASGEIDLAALTEGWSDDITQWCVNEYLNARWPDGVPRGFWRSLDIARLYFQFRWLGEPKWGLKKGTSLWRRFYTMRDLAKRLDLL